MLLIAAGLLALVGAFVLLRPVSSTATFNSSDVMFAQMMLPHHRQAIDMAEMVLQPDRDSSLELQSMARAIQLQQSSEVTTLENLLRTWRADAEAGDHSGMMDGILSDEELGQLNSLQGTEFDHAWSLAMIEHHQGAIAMARDVLETGINHRIAVLANDVVAAQGREIRELQQIVKATSN
jgi:uncharacterized protein (DUF305 family)